MKFFACGKEAIEVTHSFNHFQRMLSDVSKVIQNGNLDFLRIGRPQQKQVIAREFPNF